MNIMTRKRKTKDPCALCRLHKSRCLCDQIPSISVRTRVCLIIHAKELKRTTNTGQLAIKALVNSEMKIRGEKNNHLHLDEMVTSEYHPLLFFPSDEATELTTSLLTQFTKPVLLIVPDGNWRQASKVNKRYPALAGIQRIKLSAKNMATEFLRKENTDHGMATLQAIAIALGLIEGEAVQKQLMNLYDLKLQRTLDGRGPSQRNSQHHL